MKTTVTPLNGILGAGTQRRTNTPAPRMNTTRLWEVRPKFGAVRQTPPAPRTRKDR